MGGRLGGLFRSDNKDKLSSIATAIAMELSLAMYILSPGKYSYNHTPIHHAMQRVGKIMFGMQGNFNTEN